MSLRLARTELTAPTDELPDGLLAILPHTVDGHAAMVSPDFRRQPQSPVRSCSPPRSPHDAPRLGFLFALQDDSLKVGPIALGKRKRSLMHADERAVAPRFVDFSMLAQRDPEVDRDHSGTGFPHEHSEGAVQSPPVAFSPPTKSLHRPSTSTPPPLGTSLDPYLRKETYLRSAKFRRCIASQRSMRYHLSQAATKECSRPVSPSACHVCRHKPTLRSQLSNFRDCALCEKRVCQICVRECEAGCDLLICSSCCDERGPDGVVVCMACDKAMPLDTT